MAYSFIPLFAVLFFFFIWFMFLIISILGTLFWIFMIVDVAKRKFKQENDKVIWILVVILAGLIGAIIYYFMIKRPDKH
ncbi:MAG: PLDc N-terminal domain-containing protein [Candidatus Nanoarchaeia archaeon]